MRFEVRVGVSIIDVFESKTYNRVDDGLMTYANICHIQTFMIFCIFSTIYNQAQIPVLYSWYLCPSEVWFGADGSSEIQYLTVRLPFQYLGPHR